MGVYINPGNRAFSEIADEDYVDMTGLINLINRAIGTKDKLICVSRPRRFGKSWAASMLTAYYDCSCDSSILFDHRKISRTKLYREHLNQYNVVYLDVSGFTSSAKREGIPLSEVPGMMISALREEMNDLVPGLAPDISLEKAMIQHADQKDGKPFIFIIDEWDSVIREATHDEEAQERYLSLLRGWFKNRNFTPRAIAAVYMTGILPIKKDGTQTAISDFQEYSMLHPGEFVKYTGFTANDVRRICRKHRMSYEDISTWYDGYELEGTASIYNPYSVMQAMRMKECRSFWGKSSSAEALTAYIKMNFDGLQETIAGLIAGTEAGVNPDGFQNDFESFRSRDDVLTLLIHLGYLTYDPTRGAVRIPNEEVRLQFIGFLSSEDVGEHWFKLIRRSNQLLKDTLNGDGDAVAAAIEHLRSEQYAPQFYNHEQALRAVIKYAYLSAIGKYMRVDEMPTGRGMADVVFIPAAVSKLPAMVVELKWNKTADGAIAQIRERNYPAALEPYAGNILLVGINYDEKHGVHTCKIERA